VMLSPCIAMLCDAILCSFSAMCCCLGAVRCCERDVRCHRVRRGSKGHEMRDGGFDRVISRLETCQELPRGALQV
jgi:hypothetical protein